MQFTTIQPKRQDTNLAIAPRFLRELSRLADPNDERADTLIQRIQVDVLELILHTRRRELGVVSHG